MTTDTTVLAFPDYTNSNPYQRALARALEAQGVSMSVCDGKTPLLPLTRVAFSGTRPDVIHIHFLSPYLIVSDERQGRFIGFVLSCLLGVQLLVELAAMRLAGIRIVWTAHDLLNHDRHAIPVEKAVKHIFVRFICHAVIIHCDRAGELLINTFYLPEDVDSKFTVIPHGHFLDHYKNDITRREARDALGLEDAGTVYLYFGWIRRYKNVPYLVETFSRLDDPDARLLVVGNPQTESLRREIVGSATSDDRIHTMFEFVPDEEIQRYMNAADVVVLPFRIGRQTMLTSGSVILSMCFGRAVITPRLGCVGSLVGDGGILYDHDRQLGDAVKAALTADLTAMGTRNRERIARYDWSKIATRTRSVYERRR